MISWKGRQLGNTNDTCKLLFIALTLTYNTDRKNITHWTQAHVTANWTWPTDDM